MIPDYMDRKHDYSFARDRQLQNKLLAADDIFDQAKLIPTVSAPRPSNLRDPVCEVTGWYPKDTALRRPEHDILSKPRTSVGTREGLLTRDRSKRDHHDSTFTFYHYPESHRYIEQYRREHTCSDSTNSATTRNEFLELQRFYAYRSQTGSLYTHPTAVGYMPQSQTQTFTTTAKRDSNIAQYRSSEPSLVRSASRYKLSPSLNVRSEPEFSREGDQSEPGPLQVGANAGSTSKMAIHAVSKTPIPKVPAKVIVPANQSTGVNKTIKAGRKTGSPKTSVTAWENGVGAMRTLDTLACVARLGEKAEENTASSTPPLPELISTPRALEERVDPQPLTPNLRSDSENSDPASFDRLSTTCLAADLSLKPRPRLEPSCTYHVFPGEDMLTDTPTLFTSSMLWNPAKSTLDRRSSQMMQFDPGLNNPFKNNVISQVPVKVPDKEQMVKEFINDLKPLNLSLSSADAPKTEILQCGLRGSGTKPDLPSTFELQGISRSGRPATQQEPRARRGKGKLRHRDSDRKSQSAHSISTETEHSTSSRSLRARNQERDDGTQSDGTSTHQPAMPYFKFWNSSLPSRLKGEALPKQDSPRNGEMNLRKIAELMLNNEELPEGELEELIRRRANQSPGNMNRGAPSIASGVNHDMVFSTGDAPSSEPWSWSSEADPPQTAADAVPWHDGDLADAHHPPTNLPRQGDSLTQDPHCPWESLHAPERQEPDVDPRSMDAFYPEGSFQLPKKEEGELSPPADQREGLQPPSVVRPTKLSLPSGQSGVPQLPITKISFPPDENSVLQFHSAGRSPRDSTLQTAVSLSRGSNIRTDSLSPSSCNTVAFKSETFTRALTDIPTHKAFDADSVRMLSDDASCTAPTTKKPNKILPATETPSTGDEKLSKQRGTECARSATYAAKAQGEKVEPKKKDAKRCMVPEVSLSPLSVLSIKFNSPAAAENKGGRTGSGEKRRLQERRETVRLAPTRPGLFMDKAGAPQHGEDEVGMEGAVEDSVNLDDLSSYHSGSLNSSLEVILSSPDDTAWSPYQVKQEEESSCKQQVSSGLKGTGVGHKDAQESTAISGKHDTNSKSVFNQCGTRVNNANKDSHYSQQTFDMDRSKDTKRATFECGRDLHQHQEDKRKTVVGVVGSNNNVSNRRIDHKDTPDSQAGYVYNRPEPVSPSVWLNLEENTRQGPAQPAGHVEGQLSYSRNSTQQDTERQLKETQEKMIMLDTRQLRQQANCVPVYHPDFNKAQQRITSPYLHVAYNVEESQPKKPHQNTYPQASTYLNELGIAKSRTAAMHSKPEGETTPTTIKQSDLPGSGRISHIRASRLTPAPSSAMPRMRTAAVIRTSSSVPVYTVTGHRLRSPRKGVPLPRSSRTCMLVYHEDVDDMVVVGSDCAHRPYTTPSFLSRKTTASDTDAARKSQARWSSSLQNRDVPDLGEGLKTSQPDPIPPPSARSEAVVKSKAPSADVRAEGAVDKTFCDDSVGNGDEE